MEIKLTINITKTVSQPNMLLSFLFLNCPIISSRELILTIKNKIIGEIIPFSTAE